MTDKRHSIIAESIAAIILLSFVAYIGAAIFGLLGAGLAAVTAPWFTVYTLIVVMSGTKLYGKNVLNAAKRITTRFARAYAKIPEDEKSE